MGSNQKLADFLRSSELTEPLRRGRRRIRPKFVPELVAYLVVCASRYQRIIDRFSVIDAKHMDNTVAGTVAYARSAIKVIQHLIDNVNEGFDKFDWEPAVNLVEKMVYAEGTPYEQEFAIKLDTREHEQGS